MIVSLGFAAENIPYRGAPLRWLVQILDHLSHFGYTVKCSASEIHFQTIYHGVWNQQKLT